MEPSTHNNSYGTLKNGTWSGVRGQLQREVNPPNFILHLRIIANN